MNVFNAAGGMPDIEKLRAAYREAHQPGGDSQAGKTDGDAKTAQARARAIALAEADMNMNILYD